MRGNISQFFLGPLLMVLSLKVMSLEKGLILNPENLKASLVLSFIITLFLTVIKPSVGSFYQWRGVFNGWVLFATLSTGISQILGGSTFGDGLFFQGLSVLQNFIQKIASLGIGGDLGQFFTSPLYLLISFILLNAFAFKSEKIFFLFILILLGFGLFPFRPIILAGYFIWFAGFALMKSESPLFLPLVVKKSLDLNLEEEELLIQARELSYSNLDLNGMEPLFLKNPTLLKRGIQFGLLDLSPQTGKLRAEKMLLESSIPQGGVFLADSLSLSAGAILFLLGFIYLLNPVDILPFGIFGPLGLLDDLVFLFLTSIPLIKELIHTLNEKKKTLKGKDPFFPQLKS